MDPDQVKGRVVIGGTSGRGSRRRRRSSMGVRVFW